MEIIVVSLDGFLLLAKRFTGERLADVLASLGLFIAEAADCLSTYIDVF